MTTADEKRFRAHKAIEPPERPASRRVKIKRHEKWRNMPSMFELGIEEVEYETLSAWHYFYLTMACRCLLTTSADLRPGSIFGYWAEECSVDPELHEQAICLGLGVFPADRFQGAGAAC